MEKFLNWIKFFGTHISIYLLIITAIFIVWHFNIMGALTTAGIETPEDAEMIDMVGNLRLFYIPLGTIAGVQLRFDTREFRKQTKEKQKEPKT